MTHAAPATTVSPRNARIFRRIGLALDAAGSLIVLASLTIAGMQMWVLTELSGGENSVVRDYLNWSANVDSAPFVCLLFATCALIPGEILRRGAFGPPSAAGRQSGTERSSLVAQFRPIGLRVHAAWGTVLGILAIALTVGLSRSATEQTWPATVRSYRGSSVSSLLGVWAALFAALACATVGSFVKKAVYRRITRRRGQDVADGRRGQAFWAGFTMVWRFDLWMCGAAGIALAYAGIDLYSDTHTAIGLGAVGVVLLVTGIGAAANYWRAGVPIGVGVSAR